MVYLKLTAVCSVGMPSMHRANETLLAIAVTLRFYAKLVY